MPVEFITIIVILFLLELLMLGLPIAFCLLGSGVMLTAVFLKPQALYLVASSVFGQMSSEILIAIPLLPEWERDFTMRCISGWVA